MKDYENLDYYYNVNTKVKNLGERTLTRYLLIYQRDEATKLNSL